MADFNELSTGVQPVNFSDENGDPTVPNAITWTWSTKDGATVINSRENVAVTVPSTSINITLQGSDLAILDDESGRTEVDRLLTVEFDYNSDLGSNLPGKEETILTVKNLKKVP